MKTLTLHITTSLLVLALMLTMMLAYSAIALQESRQNYRIEPAMIQIYKEAK